MLAASADAPAQPSAAPADASPSKQQQQSSVSSAAVDIKSARSSSFNAPTPANTPSAASIALQKFVSPSSSATTTVSATATSSMSTSDVKPDAAALMAQNPQLMRALQGRLEGLVGQSSGYIESLPAPIKRRLDAMKKLVLTQAELEAQFRVEMLELEKKYLKLYAPIYATRAKIISGEHEPTDVECELPAPEEDDEDESEAEEAESEDDDDAAKPAPLSIASPFDENVKGVPEFWLTVFKTSPILEQLVTEKDEEALVSLRDIRVTYLDEGMTFRMEFEFAPNDFFTDAILTKTYQLKNDIDPDCEDITFDDAQGCVINWKAGKDLTKKIEMRKQRHKSSQKTRIVKKTVPAESFFNFFEPPTLPDGEAAAGEDFDFEAFEEALENDYQVADHIAETIIPRAIDWFTGKALENFQDDDEDDENEYDYDDEDEDDSDDDNDESDDSDDKDAAPPRRGGNAQRHQPKVAHPKAAQPPVATDPSKPPPECKQQ